MKRFERYVWLFGMCALALSFLWHLSRDLYEGDYAKIDQDITPPVYLDMEAMNQNPADVALDQADD